jgi:hypothetical protein
MIEAAKLVTKLGAYGVVVDADRKVVFPVWFKFPSDASDFLEECGQRGMDVDFLSDNILTKLAEAWTREEPLDVNEIFPGGIDR